MLNQAIEVLLAHSLLDRDSRASTLSVHRLVQAVLRDTMPQEAAQQWKQRAVNAVNTAFSDTEFPNWSNCERCLPHALLCSTWIEQEQLITREADHLLYETASYLHERGRYTEAEPLSQRSSAISEQVVGENHPDTAASLNNLAGLYWDQGKYAKAEPLYQRALAIYEQALGESHPSTAYSLNNLAMLHKDQGKYEEAEPLLKRALATLERALGPHHPNTNTVRRNYASLLHDMGRYDEAKAFEIQNQSDEGA